MSFQTDSKVLIMGAMNDIDTVVAHEALKPAAIAWFAALRNRICAAFEAIEDAFEAEAPVKFRAAPPPAGRFVRTAWDRPEGGGGADERDARPGV